jgi:hypothetical protein
VKVGAVRRTFFKVARGALGVWKLLAGERFQLVDHGPEPVWRLALPAKFSAP